MENNARSNRLKTKSENQFIEESSEEKIERAKKYVESFFPFSQDKTSRNASCTYHEFLQKRIEDERYDDYNDQKFSMEENKFVRNYFQEMWNKLPSESIRKTMQKYYESVLNTPLEIRLSNYFNVHDDFYELQLPEGNTASATILGKESILRWKAGKDEYNLTEALNFLEYAADNGCPEACYLLATTEIQQEFPRYDKHGHEINDKIEKREYLCKNEEVRKVYLLQACQSNYGPAVRKMECEKQLQDYTEEQWGVYKKEEEESFKRQKEEHVEKRILHLEMEERNIFNLAKSGNIEAQLSIGKILLKKNELQVELSGIKNEEYISQSWEWIEKASEYSDEAKYILVKAGKRNITESWSILQELAEREDVEESILLEAAKYAVALKKNKETEKYLRKAVISGNQEARFKLAQFLIEFKKESKDAEKEARVLFIKSAETMNRGSLMAGLMYLRGIGGEVDTEKAREYFEKATRKNEGGGLFDSFVDLHDIEDIYQRQHERENGSTLENIDDQIDLNIAKGESTKFCAELALISGWAKSDIYENMLELLLRWMERYKYKGFYGLFALKIEDLRVLEKINKELNSFPRYRFPYGANSSFFWKEIYKTKSPVHLIQYMYLTSVSPNINFKQIKEFLELAYQEDKNIDVSNDKINNNFSIIENYFLGRVAMSNRSVEIDIGLAESSFKRVEYLIKKIDPYVPNSIACIKERDFFKWLKDCNTKSILAARNMILEKSNSELEATRVVLEEKNLELDKANLELMQAKSDLEDMMAMFAHKFRGPVASIIANADSQHKNREVLFKDIGRTMDGLLDVFGYVSTHSENLLPRLYEDSRGGHKIVHVFNKALWLAIVQLLTKRNVDRMNMHYYNYARNNDRIPLNTEYKAWRKEKRCRDVREAIRSTWEIDIGAYGDFNDIDRLVEWCSTKIIPIKFTGIKESKITFTDSGVKESLLLVIFTEIFVNAIKHYDGCARNGILIEWAESAEEMKLVCTNPTSPDARVRGEGSGRGLKFLSLIAKNVKGIFSPPENKDCVTVAFSFPTKLFHHGE